MQASIMDDPNVPKSAGLTLTGLLFGQMMKFIKQLVETILSPENPPLPSTKENMLAVSRSSSYLPIAEI